MNGITRTITLANTKVLSRHQAMAVARRILLRAQIGEDPAAERKRTRKFPAYADFLALYWTHATKRWKPNTLDTLDYYRPKHLDGAFAGKFIDDIDVADVQAWFNRVSVKGGPGAANRCLEILHTMFNYAERLGLRLEGSNPCAFVPANKRRKCERFL